jgi:hypothetical protein
MRGKKCSKWKLYTNVDFIFKPCSYSLAYITSGLQEWSKELIRMCPGVLNLVSLNSRVYYLWCLMNKSWKVYSGFDWTYFPKAFFAILYLSSLVMFIYCEMLSDVETRNQQYREQCPCVQILLLTELLIILDFTVWRHRAFSLVR